jgi:phosphoribosyl 1,2-cyclic phosphodiesterase
VKFSFHVIASGSNGNASVISTPEGSLLIDDGISRKRYLVGLQQLDIPLEDIKGILVTHGHSDHVQGLPVLSVVIKAPVYCTLGTKNRFLANKHLDKRWLTIANQSIISSPGSTFDIGSFSITSLSTKHDADESVGFQISYKDEKMTILTDTGALTPTHLQALEESSIALVEMNHDVHELLTSRRPLFLKRRIRACHLSNEETISNLDQLVESNIKNLYIGHLSGECNSPELVKESITVWEEEQSVPWNWFICRRDGITEKFDVNRELMKKSAQTEITRKKGKIRKRTRIGKTKTLDHFFNKK